MRKVKEFDPERGINPDPFCPVRLTPFVNNGKITDKLMLELQLPDSDIYATPAGSKVCHTASYKLITNQQVHALAAKVMEASGRKFDPIPNFNGSHSRMLDWNGTTFTERWFTKDIACDTGKGSMMMLGLEARNSYDGSCRASLAFFAMHCACSNQFKSSRLLGEPFTFPHIASGDIERDVDASLHAISHEAAMFPERIDNLRRLNEKHVDSFEDFLKLRSACKAATGIDFREKALLDELSGTGITHQLGIDVGDAYGDPSSYWAIANAYTAILTHELGMSREATSSQCDRLLTFLMGRI